ncbi:MAG: hypothetical protein Q9170_004974 [Blastenia crenularia]
MAQNPLPQIPPSVINSSTPAYNSLLLAHPYKRSVYRNSLAMITQLLDERKTLFRDANDNQMATFNDNMYRETELLWAKMRGWQEEAKWEEDMMQARNTFATRVSRRMRG